MFKRLIDRLFGVEPEVVDPNDIGTGTEDIRLMELDEILRRLARDINPDTFLVDDEDDTANFDMEVGEYD